MTTPSAAARRTRAPRRAAAILAALLAGLALLSGCTQAPQEQPATATTTSPSPTASPTPTPTPTTASPTPTPSPTPVPSPFPTATAPTARLDAGTVGETDPVTVEGTGPSRVEVTRDGDFALVVSVDCPECIRPVTVTGPDQTEPLLSGPAPYRGAALFAVNEPDADEQELWVFADAEWHLGIESWNDIQPTFGELEGSGSAVALVGDEVDGFDVWCDPPPGESCTISAYSGVETTATGAPVSRVITGRIEITDEVSLPLPGVVNVITNGEWRITPWERE